MLTGSPDFEAMCTWASARGSGRVAAGETSPRSVNCLLLFQVINRELMTGSPLVITCIWWLEEVCFEQSYQLGNTEAIHTALTPEFNTQTTPAIISQRHVLEISFSYSSTFLTLASFISYSCAFSSFFPPAHVSKANFLNFSSPMVAPLQPLPHQFRFVKRVRLQSHGTCVRGQLAYGQKYDRSDVIPKAEAAKCVCSTIVSLRAWICLLTSVHHFNSPQSLLWHALSHTGRYFTSFNWYNHMVSYL